MKFDRQETSLVEHYWATAHKNALVLVTADSVAPGTLVVAHLPDEYEYPEGELHMNYWPFIVTRVTTKHVRVAGIIHEDLGSGYPTTLPLRAKVAVLR